MAMHGALLWGQWTPDVTLFLNDAFAPDEEQTRQLAARRVTVVPGALAAVADDGVHLADGSVVARDYLVVQSRLEARGDLLTSIGLKPVDHPMGIGTYVPAEDPTGRTSVPGVWVAGNVTDPMAQVITSAGAGLMAGAVINTDLVMAETAEAVAAPLIGERPIGPRLSCPPWIESTWCCASTTAGCTAGSPRSAWARMITVSGSARPPARRSTSTTAPAGSTPPAWTRSG